MNTAGRLLIASTLPVLLLLGACADNPHQFRVTGDNAMAAGQYQRAADDYQRYLELRPGEPEVRSLYGRALLKAGKPDEAVHQLAVVAYEQPTDENLEAYCDALAAANKYDELHRTLRTYAGERGQASDFVRYGKYAMVMGDADAAKTAYITALRMDNARNLPAHLGLYDLYTNPKTPYADSAKALRHLRMGYAIRATDRGVNERAIKSHQILGPSFALTPEVDPNE